MIARRFAIRLVCALAFAGCTSLSLAVADEQAAEVTVKIENFTFSPAELTIKPGTAVTWENADDIPHSIVENSGRFHSKPLDTGDKFTMIFKDAGDVAYYCGFHTHMQGKIVVKP